MTSGAIHVAQVPESGWPCPLPPPLGCNLSTNTTANGSRSGGVALLRPSRSALRRSELGHGHGQAIGAGMHGSAPWKIEETIVGLPRLLVLPVFSRFGGRHLSAPPVQHIDSACRRKRRARKRKAHRCTWLISARSRRRHLHPLEHCSRSIRRRRCGIPARCGETKPRRRQPPPI